MKYFLIAVLFLIPSNCLAQSNIGLAEIGEARFGNTTTVDINLDADTILLRESLLDNMETSSPYFGEHMFTFYGTDVFDITGKYPYIREIDYTYWWLDVGYIETLNTQNTNHINAGGIIMVMWHMSNPVNDGDSWNTGDDPVTNSLPGGTHRTEYLAMLSSLGDWLNAINYPIILRLFHENDQGFWWGPTTCTDKQFQQLWIDMVRYLRDTKNVHNVLYAYSPTLKTGYDYKGDLFPGEEWVDLYGLDYYSDSSSDAIASMEIVSDLAIADSKIFAFTEGSRNLSDFTDEQNTGYWETNYIDPILASAKAAKASFVCVFPIVGADAWGPRDGEVDATSFGQIYTDNEIQLISY